MIALCDRFVLYAFETKKSRGDIHRLVERVV